MGQRVLELPFVGGAVIYDDFHSRLSAVFPNLYSTALTTVQH